MTNLLNCGFVHPIGGEQGLRLGGPHGHVIVLLLELVLEGLGPLDPHQVFLIFAQVVLFDQLAFFVDFLPFAPCQVNRADRLDLVFLLGVNVNDDTAVVLVVAIFVVVPLPLHSDLMLFELAHNFGFLQTTS